KGSGDYTRAPGEIKVNHGKFSYKNDAVTLTDFAGTIGNSYYYNFSGSYSLDNTNVIDIKSANALVDSNEIFNWLVGFNVIEEIVPSLSVDEGYVRIDSTCIKGDIFNVKELVFDVNGLLFDNRFREKSNNNSNFLSSCRFDISNKGYSFDEIIGKVSDVDLISTFTPKGDINSLATPFMIKNGVYKSFDNIYSFNGELEFESGPIVKLSTTNHKEETCLNKLEVKEALNTNIKFLTDNNKNVDFYSFKGQLNVETLEKIFTENSHYYNKLIAFTDQSNATITSYSGSLITISACTLNLEPILDQLFAKNNDQLCLKSQNSNNFSEKKIKLKTEMLKYQGSHFGNFIVDLSLKQERNKFQGTLDITSKLGKINGLTLISRILSAINISNYFKNGGPDFKQTGFKYKSIVIKANIVDNKILLKEAVIDGQDMTLVFTGSIDIKKNDLNLTCLIAPFKTIDLLVEKIPVVNVMLN
ncbi:MAG: hypothetical protein GY697_21940, partial [Desulfobacterales bacterium]|nr:hypothetical protein [Desulfobacterales bacterium]